MQAPNATFRHDVTTSVNASAVLILATPPQLMRWFRTLTRLSALNPPELPREL